MYLRWWDYHLHKLDKSYLCGLVVMAHKLYLGNLEFVGKGIDICINVVFPFEKNNKNKIKHNSHMILF
jgi:hypothetical protein